MEMVVIERMAMGCPLIKWSTGKFIFCYYKTIGLSLFEVIH